jgi:hypothetical protein
MRREVWTVSTDSAVLLRRWPGEDEVLAFHEPSGNLHLLTPLAASVLSRLVSSPRSTDQLVDDVPGLTAPEAERIVTILERLGLITVEQP